MALGARSIDAVLLRGEEKSRKESSQRKEKGCEEIRQKNTEPGDKIPGSISIPLRR